MVPIPIKIAMFYNSMLRRRIKVNQSTCTNLNYIILLCNYVRSTEDPFQEV